MTDLINFKLAKKALNYDLNKQLCKFSSDICKRRADSFIQN